MDNESVKRFAIKLAKAESESEVLTILKDYGYLHDKSCWQPFGGNENNFSVIGAQQSSADAALVEKLINSVDAVLIRKSYEKNINPESPKAPKSMREAMDMFFSVPQGKLLNISKTDRTSLSQNIQLYASGKKKKPNYFIVDSGEGQTPNRLPDTILSISKNNKLRIPFVQGKFNMGGTGVLQFCGDQNFQVIISKRCPSIPEKYNRINGEQDDSSSYWGVTIVRRGAPEVGAKSSSYQYLAPNNKILSFEADNLPILPNNRPFEWGTFIKLYEYKLSGLRTIATFDLYYRLSVLLPSVALPIRIIETRDYKGHTLETTLTGLNVRLEEDRNNNLEEGFPYQSHIVVQNKKINYSLYVFKEGKGSNYRINEGVIFVINGQTHGSISKSIYKRKAVGLGYISDSVLAVLDCSDLDLRSREDLFMNNRDSLRNVELKKQIEKTLEEDFKNNKLLKELNEKRREDAIKNKIGNSKPMSDVLNKLIHQSDSLKRLLLSGTSIESDEDIRKRNKGPHRNKSNYRGKQFPTFFDLKNGVTGKGQYIKEVPKNRRARILFKTDVENNYFGRELNPGRIKLTLNGVKVPNYSITLLDGIAALYITLPSNCRVGQTYNYQVEVTDIVQKNPFVEQFQVLVSQPVKMRTPTKKKKSVLEPPNVYDVEEGEWERHGMNENSVLRIMEASEGKYDFYVNVKNKSLLSEIENSEKDKSELVKAQFKFGMSLIGLSIIQAHYKEEREDDEEGKEPVDITKQVDDTTKQIAPVFIPMLKSLSTLQLEEENIV
ncbi:MULTISPECIES: hypothetical protein [Bacillaceae]|uniref:Uncharacterized protein n=1 Tax=Evansella alkalicola TaxID=745819 RepID=A0ABS6K294_9BACI|nr:MULTISPECIES: hypothetical protein [Bacillaceae]MBU9723822.1 hypothetical protein [Bacillus alkalicola]